MAGEVNPQYRHRKSPSSQFTTSTYPGGLPCDTTHRCGSGSSLPFSAVRRRKCILATFTLVFLVTVYFLGTSTTASFHSIYTQPNLNHTSSDQDSIVLVQTTVFMTNTVYLPGPTQTAVIQSQGTPTLTDLTYQPLGAVVFVLIMWSRTAAVEGALLIKSILMYNTSPSEFHIICDDEAEDYLRSRFALVNRPHFDVLVRFYKPTWQTMLDRIEREGTIKTDHSAGLPGLMKLFIHEIIPVKRGIYIDTDAFFISDPTLLWNVFGGFKASTAVAMSSHPDQSSPEWHHASRICSCIMLLELEKLRNLRLMGSSIYQADSSHHFAPALASDAFRAMYGLPGGDGHGKYDNVRLGDQGYWWAIVSHRPDIFEPLNYDFEVTSCLLNTYNVGLGEDDVEESEELLHQSFLAGTPQEGKVVLPKLLHFNCLHGVDFYMDWEGWSNPGDVLTQRWGAAMKYHAGYKWIWLNNGQGSVQMETTGVVFADEKFANELNAPTPSV